MARVTTGEARRWGFTPLAFLLEVALLFHCLLSALGSSRSRQRPPEHVRVGLRSSGRSPALSAGLSSRSMSSSLCTGGVVEEGRAAVLPKRLWLSRDDPEDRVDTRLTGRSPSPSDSSTHSRLSSGPESLFARWCSPVERGEVNWGYSRTGKRDKRGGVRLYAM